MRKLTLIVLLLCTQSVMGQSGIIRNFLNMGVKFGVNSQSMTFKDIGTTNSYNMSANEKMGYHMGIVTRVNLGLFSIQPELNYMMSNFNLTATRKQIGGSAPDYNAKCRINTIELPVLLNLRFLFIRIAAGPVFNLVNEGKVVKSDIATDFTVKKPSVGLALGCGLSYSHLDFDLRYRREFGKTEYNIMMNSESGIGSYEGKYNGWMLSVGYIF